MLARGPGRRSTAGSTCTGVRPGEAPLADLFWEARHCHEESAFPRAWDLFDAAVIRRVD
ncbi:hypothetical protein LV779_35445 [Streptomyces thinghirensis]|nr:hypothetical protein [Streptomyces thinghirensis]